MTPKLLLILLLTGLTTSCTKKIRLTVDEDNSCFEKDSFVLKPVTYCDINFLKLVDSIHAGVLPEIFRKAAKWEGDTAPKDLRSCSYYMEYFKHLSSEDFYRLKKLTDSSGFDFIIPNLYKGCPAKYPLTYKSIIHLMDTFWRTDKALDRQALQSDKYRYQLDTVQTYISFITHKFNGSSRKVPYLMYQFLSGGIVYRYQLEHFYRENKTYLDRSAVTKMHYLFNTGGDTLSMVTTFPLFTFGKPGYISRYTQQFTIKNHYCPTKFSSKNIE